MMGVIVNQEYTVWWTRGGARESIKVREKVHWKYDSRNVWGAKTIGEGNENAWCGWKNPSILYWIYIFI